MVGRIIGWQGRAPLLALCVGLCLGCDDEPGSLNAPKPVISEVSPATLLEGEDRSTVALTGEGFTSDTKVFFGFRYTGSEPVPFDLTGGNSIVVHVGPAPFLHPGYYQVTVINPPPGGGAATAEVHVTGRPPEVVEVVPGAITFGQTATFSIRGRYLHHAVVLVDGVATTAAGGAGDTLHTVRLAGRDMRSAGVKSVEIDTRNERFHPGGGVTFAEIFIGTPPPSLQHIWPQRLKVGEPSTTTVLVYANPITDESVVLWDGQPRPTTRDRDNRLLVVATAEDQATPDTIEIRVRTPGASADSNPMLLPIIP